MFTINGGNMVTSLPLVLLGQESLAVRQVLSHQAFLALPRRLVILAGPVVAVKTMVHSIHIMLSLQHITGNQLIERRTAHRSFCVCSVAHRFGPIGAK